MLERTLIFGNGWLGNKFSRALDAEVVYTDITNREAVMQKLDSVRPTVVINAAGKTGRPNVDGCEHDPAGTFLVNVAGPIILAEECLSRGIFMVHLGSGCVYEGDKTAFTEDDPPNFSGSVYSRSKALSEQALRELPVLQIRLRMPFDDEPNPRNLITKLVGYRRIISVPNSLTYVPELLRATFELMERRLTGVWNVTNPGAMTHKRILDLYREIVDPKHHYEEMSLKELASVTKAGRSNCVLDSRKLELAGIRLTPVEEAVVQALKRYRDA